MHSKYIRRRTSFYMLVSAIFFKTQLSSNELLIVLLIESLQRLKKGGKIKELAIMKTIFYSLRFSNLNCPQNRLI